MAKRRRKGDKAQQLIEDLLDEALRDRLRDMGWTQKADRIWQRPDGKLLTEEVAFTWLRNQSMDR